MFKGVTETISQLQITALTVNHNLSPSTPTTRQLRPQYSRRSITNNSLVGNLRELVRRLETQGKSGRKLRRPLHEQQASSKSKSTSLTDQSLLDQQLPAGRAVQSIGGSLEDEISYADLIHHGLSRSNYHDHIHRLQKRWRDNFMAGMLISY
jgi:hypothetical protein